MQRKILKPCNNRDENCQPENSRTKIHTIRLFGENQQVCKWLKIMEAAAGVEPAHKGFADLCLTTWLRRLGMGLSINCQEGAQ